MANQKLIKQMRLLGVDVGSKRMGLALWNPASQLASPLMTLIRKTLKEDLTALSEVILKNEVEGIVVGMPIALSGNETQSTQNAIFWKECLEKDFRLPIYSFDESLSTREAMSILKEQGFNARSRTTQSKKDSIAAALILEEFVRAQD